MWIAYLQRKWQVFMDNAGVYIYILDDSGSHHISFDALQQSGSLYVA
jgi:hypothetical protein